MKYFTKTTYNAETLKKEMRGFSMKLHPDRGGCQKDFCEMNKEYHDILNSMKNGSYVKEEVKERPTTERTYKYKYETKEEVKERPTTESVEVLDPVVSIPVILIDIIQVTLFIGGFFNVYLGIMFIINTAFSNRLKGGLKYGVISLYSSIMCLIYYRGGVMLDINLGNFIYWCFILFVIYLGFYIYKNALDS